MESIINKEEISELFGPESGSAFDQGRAAHLLLGRNRNLGSVIAAERGVFYVQILYRMLLFKRDHELEPLYEDIYRAVQPAQEAVSQEEYGEQQFRIDMGQLTEWQLVSFRIEKERLRGYRDNRKRKFRYRLADESAALMEWLENRTLDDLEERGYDARDLLQEVCGSLNEQLRLLHNLKRNDEGQVDEARRIIFQHAKTDDLTRTITANLIDFNGRLLHFVVQVYDPEEIKQILSELDIYVHQFLSQVYGLRQEILPLLDRLLRDAMQEKLVLCQKIMEAERVRTPHLLKGDRGVVRQGLCARLQAFYREDGTLDQLHRRIGDSVIKVWQKLRSHLRELERKNNRLQDLRQRIVEIAQLESDTAPLSFLTNLLAPAHMRGDAHYWDQFEKAEPPEPRKRLVRKQTFPKRYMAKKGRSERPVQSMDEARLSELRQWLDERLAMHTGKNRISEWQYDSFDDFAKVMEMAQAGYLNQGRRLQRISYGLQDDADLVELRAGTTRLGLREILVTQDRNSKG